MTDSTDATAARRITRDEWARVERERQRNKDTIAYNQGLEAAAQQAESWAAQSGGGSGVGGEGYTNLAIAIRRMQVPHDPNTTDATPTTNGAEPRIWFDGDQVVTRDSAGSCSGWTLEEAQDLHRLLGIILMGLGSEMRTL